MTHPLTKSSFTSSPPVSSTLPSRPSKPNGRINNGMHLTRKKNSAARPSTPSTPSTSSSISSAVQCEKRKRVHPKPCIPSCEFEYPNTSAQLTRSLLRTKDEILYDVLEAALRPSVKLMRMIQQVRNNSSGASSNNPTSSAASTSGLSTASTAATTGSNSNVWPITNYSSVVHDLPEVDGQSFDQVLKFCYFHTSRNAVNERCADEWNQMFVDALSPTQLCGVASAAFFLEISSLTDVACRAIANDIKGKTPHEIRAAFDIPEDQCQHPNHEENYREFQKLSQQYAKKCQLGSNTCQQHLDQICDQLQQHILCHADVHLEEQLQEAMDSELQHHQLQQQHRHAQQQPDGRRGAAGTSKKTEKREPMKRQRKPTHQQQQLTQKRSCQLTDNKNVESHISCSSIEQALNHCSLSSPSSSSTPSPPPPSSSKRQQQDNGEGNLQEPEEKSKGRPRPNKHPNTPLSQRCDCCVPPHIRRARQRHSERFGSKKNENNGVADDDFDDDENDGQLKQCCLAIQSKSVDEVAVWIEQNENGATDGRRKKRKRRNKKRSKTAVGPNADDKSKAAKESTTQDVAVGPGDDDEGQQQQVSDVKRNGELDHDDEECNGNGNGNFETNGHQDDLNGSEVTLIATSSSCCASSTLDCKKDFDEHDCVEVLTINDMFTEDVLSGSTITTNSSTGALCCASGMCGEGSTEELVKMDAEEEVREWREQLKKMEKRIAKLNAMIKKMTKERDENQRNANSLKARIEEFAVGSKH